MAEGVEAAGATATIKRVPELTPEDVARAHNFKLDQPAPIAEPNELADYDAIIFGTPTRFGNMASQMRSFLDQTGGLWVQGKLAGKVGSVFTSTGTGSGNETTISSFWTTLAHQGMVIVGLPYTCPEISDISEVLGGSPYGAGTIAGGDGSLKPKEKELNMGSLPRKARRRNREKAQRLKPLQGHRRDTKRGIEGACP